MILDCERQWSSGLARELCRSHVHHECVRPRRETALAPVGAQLVDDEEQRIAGDLLDEVLAILRGRAARPIAAPGELVPRRTLHQIVKLSELPLTRVTPRGQAIEPGA